MSRPAIGMCFDRSFPASAVPEFARALEASGGAVVKKQSSMNLISTTPPATSARANSGTAEAGNDRSKHKPMAGRLMCGDPTTSRRRGDPDGG